MQGKLQVGFAGIITPIERFEGRRKILNEFLLLACPLYLLQSISLGAKLTPDAFRSTSICHGTSKSQQFTPASSIAVTVKKLRRMLVSGSLSCMYVLVRYPIMPAGSSHESYSK